MPLSALRPWFKAGILVGLFVYFSSAVTLTFDPTHDIFANPGRGYFGSEFIYTSFCDERGLTPRTGQCPPYDWTSNGSPLCAQEGGLYHCWRPLSPNIEAMRAADSSTRDGTWKSTSPYRSLIQRVVYLDSNVSALSNIPQVILNGIQADCDAVRAAGMKMLIRFAYAALYPRTGSGGTMPDPDDLNRIKTHVDDIGAVLSMNADVVVAVQLGFLGFWGEGHWWDPQIDGPVGSRPDSWFSELIDAQLVAFDPSILVLVRTPNRKYDHPSNFLPLNRSVDVNDVRRRIGFHNDCFMSGLSDQGTFGSDDPYTEVTGFELEADCGSPFTDEQRFLNARINCDRDYVKNEARYTGNTGETCGGDADRFTCAQYTAELREYGYFGLHLYYDQSVLNRFNTSCHDFVRNHLGYRYNLLNFTLDAVSKTISFNIQNVGFTRPLQNQLMNLYIGSQRFQIETTGRNDMRLLSAGDVLSFQLAFPAVINGLQDVYLEITDASDRLKSNVAYNVRIASNLSYANGRHFIGRLDFGAAPTPSQVAPSPSFVVISPTPLPTPSMEPSTTSPPSVSTPHASPSPLSPTSPSVEISTPTSSLTSSVSIPTSAPSIIAVSPSLADASPSPLSPTSPSVEISTPTSSLTPSVSIPTSVPSISAVSPSLSDASPSPSSDGFPASIPSAIDPSAPSSTITPSFSSTDSSTSPSMRNNMIGVVLSLTGCALHFVLECVTY